MPFFKKRSAKQSKDQSQSNKQPAGRPVVPPAQKPESPNADIGLPTDLLSNEAAKQKITLLPLNRNLSNNDSYQEMGDLGHPSLLTSDNPRVTSRLSKSLMEVINDKNALPLLIQYMETRDAVHFIKFYLDAESFQAASWTRIRSHSMNTDSKSNVLNGKPESSLSATSTNPGSGQKNSSISDNTSRLSNCATATETLHCENTGKASDCSSSRLEVSHNHLATECNTESTQSRTLNGAVGVRLESTVPDSHRQSSHLDTTHENVFGQRLRQSIERDAVSIYSKYIALDCSHPIGISEALRNSTVHKICGEDGHVDPLCFVDCQKFVVEVMDKEYYPDFLKSEYYCKVIIDILTSGKVYLADVLYNDTAMFYFTEYMEQEGAMGLIQFWMGVDNFQQHLVDIGAKYDPAEAQTDAMVLYDRYFSLQASEPLGFDDSVRFQVESNICREGGPLPDCFVEAKKIVLNTVDQIYFKQFLQSNMYYKYMTEMVNTAQNLSEFPQIRKRREGSFDSDSQSISSQKSADCDAVKKTTDNDAIRNTLLAAGSGSNPLIKKVVDRLNDERMDGDFLFSDTPLWKRDQAGKMSFGRINEFGQFESEIAPGPETKKGSRFGKKKKEKDRSQEDMAWQIAQIVINDVTSVTLKTSDSCTSTEAESSGS